MGCAHVPTLCGCLQASTALARWSSCNQGGRLVVALPHRHRSRLPMSLASMPPLQYENMTAPGSRDAVLADMQRFLGLDPRLAPAELPSENSRWGGRAGHSLLGRLECASVPAVGPDVACRCRLPPAPALICPWLACRCVLQEGERAPAGLAHAARALPGVCGHCQDSLAEVRARHACWFACLLVLLPSFSAAAWITFIIAWFIRLPTISLLARLAAVLEQHGLKSGQEWVEVWEAAWARNLATCDASGDCLIQLT